MNHVRFNRVSFRNLWGGFTMMEMMIATAIFSLAGMGLVVAFNHTLEAGIAMERENEVRGQMQSLAAEVKKKPLAVGSETVEANGVKYERIVERVNLKNSRNADVGFYQLTIKAQWKMGTEEISRDMEVLVYQP